MFFFFFFVIWKEILFFELNSRFLWQLGQRSQLENLIKFIEFNQLLVKSLFKMVLGIGLGIEKVESDMT